MNGLVNKSRFFIAGAFLSVCAPCFANSPSATITIPATVIPAPPAPLDPGGAVSVTSEPAHVAKNKVYKPKIFRAHEFATLKVLTEGILRDDDTPGAREARANEFIDFQITYDPEIQDRFRSGLAWLDRHSKKLYGRNFVGLTTDQRREIIQCLEVKAKHRPGEEEGREFFELAKRYTYMGFYASEEALRIAIPVQKKPAPSKRRLAGTPEEKVNPN